MASCKDCIHSECCFMQYGKANALKWQSELGCKNFKDRSRFLELPCKVGDTLVAKCPKSCFRAQLTQDLRNNQYRFLRLPVSWASLKGTEECPLSKKVSE